LRHCATAQKKRQGKKGPFSSEKKHSTFVYKKKEIKKKRKKKTFGPQKEKKGDGLFERASLTPPTRSEAREYIHWAHVCAGPMDRRPDGP
jgi:hypothetical protein